MKLKIIFSTAILISTLATVTANAALNCSHAMAQTNREKRAIASRNWTISQSAPKLRADEAALSLLLPEKEKVDHILGIYESSKDLILQSQKVVAQVLNYLQETIVQNESMTASLEQLRKKFNPIEGVPLADQLRSLLQQGHLKHATTELIGQLANAVELLESSTSEWQDSEKELLQRYLDGEALGVVLYDSVHQLSERLTSGLNQQTNAVAADQAHADELAMKIAEIQIRVAAYKKNIEELKAANIVSEDIIDEAFNTDWKCANIRPIGSAGRGFKKNND